MYHDHIKGTSGSGTGGGLKSGSYVWLGMGVKKSEKLNEEFSNHKRPHLTTDTHIKINDKRKVALLLGELHSSRLSMFYSAFKDNEECQKELGRQDDTVFIDTSIATQ